MTVLIAAFQVLTTRQHDLLNKEDINVFVKNTYIFIDTLFP